MKRSVLIAENYGIMHDSIIGAFSEAGYEITEADGGLRAIELCAEFEYDVIIMDPPTYGRGPKGELWRFEDELFALVKKCVDVLSDNPVLFIVNSYTTGISHTVVSNVLSYLIKDKFGGEITSDELGLKMTSSSLNLPCGYTTRWYKK